MQMITVGCQPEVQSGRAECQFLSVDVTMTGVHLWSRWGHHFLKLFWMRVFSILFCWRLNHWHINDFRRNVLHNRYCRLSIHKICPTCLKLLWSIIWFNYYFEHRDYSRLHADICFWALGSQGLSLCTYLLKYYTHASPKLCLRRWSPCNPRFP